MLNPNTTFLPPVIDTWYVLTANDSFGMTDQDSVFYETIHVKSEFSFEAYDPVEANAFLPETSPYEAGAPLRIRFTNESVNGADFEWIYADTIESQYFENFLTSDFSFQPEYAYLIPDDYYPSLVAKSEEGCIDTFRLEAPVTVSPSELQVPNVFSPDGLPANRYFKVQFESIREFRIWIYSRAGNLVYQEEVFDMYAWEGWDGNIKNSDRPAPPGIYFYIIEATGYDDEEYRGSVYKGTVYLFRSKD